MKPKYEKLFESWISKPNGKLAGHFECFDCNHPVYAYENEKFVKCPKCGAEYHTLDENPKQTKRMNMNNDKHQPDSMDHSSYSTIKEQKEARIVAKRKYVGSSGLGISKKPVEVVAICKEDRGRFYVEVPSLNASGIGSGDTPDSAFADWEKKYKHGGNWHTVKNLPIIEEGKMPKGGWDKKYRGENGGFFVATKEYRKPKKGEFYISGADPIAYKAPNDLNSEYFIAKEVGTPEKFIEKDGFKYQLVHESRGHIFKNVLAESDGKILLQDTDDAAIEGDKTEVYTNEEGVRFWAEYDPEVKAWICIQQVDGYPETEAWDDWFGRKEDAEDLCQKLANGTL